MFQEDVAMRKVKEITRLSAVKLKLQFADPLQTRMGNAMKSLHGYVIPAVSMPVATILSLLVKPSLSGHSANTLFYVLAVLASAWFGGHGPGVVACLLGLLAVPFLFTQNFDPLGIDPIRASLVLSASLLISYVGGLQRKTHTALTKANLDLQAARAVLEDRVRERTLELQQSNNELQKLNSALNEFAYSASHDLQQPLRNIATQSQLLHRKYGGKLDTQANGYIQTIVRGAHDMSALLADLLAYSRSVNLKPREASVIDTRTVLTDALANLKSQIDESRAMIQVGELPLTRMHRFHLLELFQNLVGNAIKYRRPAESLLIDIAFCEVPEPCIEIRDNGIGIAPEYATQIFGLFKRLHSSDTYEGTGVGLAICEAIVERYEGRIWVEPNAPHGSVFRFTVPMAEAVV